MTKVLKNGFMRKTVIIYGKITKKLILDSFLEKPSHRLRAFKGGVNCNPPAPIGGFQTLKPKKVYIVA